MSRIVIGDCREVLRDFAAEGVRARCCVTSPPYWGLRDYGVAGQIGLEATPEDFVREMVSVFRLVRDVLTDDGVLWLNLGDSYIGAPGGFQGKNGQRASRTFTARIYLDKRCDGLKPKDLVGIPWRVAFALQADGWWLRQDVIWSKPNPMPESVADRCTKSHEYLFLLAKSRRYYFDAAAIAEPRVTTESSRPTGWASGPGSHAAADHAKARVGANSKFGEDASTRHKNGTGGQSTTRNRRSVWTITTEPYREAHFATFPQELARLCVLSGSAPGDLVLDPFMGSGTVARVALELGRKPIGCDLNGDYEQLQKRRTSRVQRLLVRQGATP